MEDSRKFIKLEAIGANLLLSATILALIVSNSPWHQYYTQISSSLHHIINDGLMSVFFLVVGLEIKYELLQGSLNSRSKALLPAFAALGGMLAPAFIYAIFNHHSVLNLRGWAIPTATDIAFSLGVVSLLNNKVPSQLKVFLTALAIFDDLAAIIIIALFYTSHLSLLFLGLALLCLGVILILNITKANSMLLYCMLGLALWICFFNAGIHPTLAGVILAFMMPLHHPTPHRVSVAETLKQLAHPVVALGILPLFAFANAGISLVNLQISNIHNSIALGIFFSLLLGKPIGILSACWLATKFRIAKLPDKVRWNELAGISVICGIGFTISLFIGTLAFGNLNVDYIDSVKVGVLGGSLASGIAGYWLLSSTIFKTHPLSRRHG